MSSLQNLLLLILVLAAIVGIALWGSKAIKEGEEEGTVSLGPENKINK